MNYLKMPITKFIYPIDEVNKKVLDKLLHHKIFITVIPSLLAGIAKY